MSLKKIIIRTKDLYSFSVIDNLLFNYHNLVEEKQSRNYL